MMDYMVKRLRAPAYWFSESDEGHPGENSAPREAADHIDALTADRNAWKANAERLAEVLRERDGGAHDADCQSLLSGGRDSTSICRCGHVEALAALAAHAKLKGGQ